MKRNIGQLDRLARAALAVLFVAFIPPAGLTPTAVAGYAIAAMLAGTSAFGYSPLYTLLKIDTTHDAGAPGGHHNPPPASG